MRKYQRKISQELRDIYQSPDPLRWVYLANKLDVERKMTPKEFRIFKRRMTETFKRAGVAVAKAFSALTGAMSKAALSISEVMANISKATSTPEDISIGRKLLSDSLYGPRVIVPKQPLIGNIPDLKITLDEGVSDDN